MGKSLNKIRILHSFAENKPVFKEFCELTFDFTEVENVFANTLYESNEALSDFDLIVVHYLRDEDCDFISRQKINTPIILFAWGADFFKLGKFHNEFLLPDTFKLRSKLYNTYPRISQLKKILHTIFPQLLDMRPKNGRRIKSLSIFDAITPVMPGDYDLVKSKYPIKGFLHHLNYVNPNLDSANKMVAKGNLVLLGNSASFTNNHLEAIDLIDRILPNNHKVLIPVSYGNKALANHIEKNALTVLGQERVKILTDFLPPDEYQQLLSQCEIVVMNHLRQQAVGNIVQALSMGAHLYLQSASPVYKYLKQHNFHLSAIDLADELHPLNQDEKNQNIQLTYEIFGKKLQQQKLAKLIEKLTHKVISSVVAD